MQPLTAVPGMNSRGDVFLEHPLDTGCKLLLAPSLEVAYRH